MRAAFREWKNRGCIGGLAGNLSIEEMAYAVWQDAWRARADLAAERIAELEARERELVEALQEIKDARAGEGHDMCSLQEIAFGALAEIGAQQQEEG